MKGAILFRAGDELKAAVDEAAGRARVTQDAFMRAAVVAMVERVQRTGRIGKENDQSVGVTGEHKEKMKMSEAKRNGTGSSGALRCSGAAESPVPETPAAQGTAIAKRRCQWCGGWGWWFLSRFAMLPVTCNDCQGTGVEPIGNAGVTKTTSSAVP